MKKRIVIGNKIKTIRESKNMTIEQLAQLSDLTIEQITTLENSEVLPSLSPLIKVARALGVRLGTFMDDNDQLGPVVSRKDETNESISFSNGGKNTSMIYSSLAKSKAGRHMEPFVISVKECTEKDFIMSSHEGEEFIYVLEGSIEINYGKEIYQLNEGDSIYYDSIVEHHVHANCNSNAKILAIVYSPV